MVAPAMEWLASSSQEPGRPFLAELASRRGESVVVHCWLAGRRRAKDVQFLVLRDRSGTIQAVCRGELAEQVARIPEESALRVEGTVRSCGVARFGDVELEAREVHVLASAEGRLSLGTDIESRLDHRYLDLRDPKKALIFHVQNTLESALRAQLLERRFMEIHTPKITAGGSESGAAVFRLPYFDTVACLAQSPQFYVQLAMAAGFDRVFEVGPVFRAEAALTNRHATEFTCIDVELSWIESHEDLMALEERILRRALETVRERHGADVERHFGVAVEVPEQSIPRVTFAEALRISGGDQKLTFSDEQKLAKQLRAECGHGFLFLTDFPASERPFYTMLDAETATTSRSFDLLWRGLEVTSGCQREHRHAQLKSQATSGGVGASCTSSYLDDYYLEMFRHGCPPHGGFGIGLDRLMMALLAQPSLRETSFVYRGPERFVP